MVLIITDQLGQKAAANLTATMGPLPPLVAAIAGAPLLNATAGGAPAALDASATACYAVRRTSGLLLLSLTPVPGLRHARATATAT